MIPARVPELVGAGHTQAEHDLEVGFLPPAAGQFEPFAPNGWIVTRSYKFLAARCLLIEWTLDRP